MSAFICANCDRFSDADDGCEEDATGLRLICIDCVEELQAEREEAEDRRQMVNVGGHRDGGSAA